MPSFTHRHFEIVMLTFDQILTVEKLLKDFLNVKFDFLFFGIQLCVP